MKQSSLDKTRRWHVTISCQPDERPPQPVRPWKSGRVHLAEGSNVVGLELPQKYSTEFKRESRKFGSGVRKYGKFSHFSTHPVVYGGQGKNIIISRQKTVQQHTAANGSQTHGRPCMMQTHTVSPVHGRRAVATAQARVMEVSQGSGVCAWSCCHLANGNKT